MKTFYFYRVGLRGRLVGQPTSILCLLYMLRKWSFWLEWALHALLLDSWTSTCHVSLFYNYHQALAAYQSWEWPRTEHHQTWACRGHKTRTCFILIKQWARRYSLKCRSQVLHVKLQRVLHWFINIIREVTHPSLGCPCLVSKDFCAPWFSVFAINRNLVFLFST